MIPHGQVASYGQIARLTGFPNHSRYVGTTMRNLPKGTKLPWWRVVNGSLRLSTRGSSAKQQQRRLRREGVAFVGERVARQCRWDAGLDCD